MAYVYAQPGPPFQFLGNLSETQLKAFKDWVNARTSNFPAITLHHRIRAQQLRKTAGILEQFYSAVNDQKLAVRANWKPAWQPGPNGHFNYAYRDDQLPMITVSQIKELFKDQLQRDDEGYFFMNQVRNLIENEEDAAQLANDSQSTDNKSNLQTLLQAIDTYFGQPQYEAALVKDQTDQYKGQPRFRVMQLDAPTQWELEQANHSSPNTPIGIKEVDPQQDPQP